VSENTGHFAVSGFYDFLLPLQLHPAFPLAAHAGVHL
jgi:hypothetical protein